VIQSLLEIRGNGLVTPGVILFALVLIPLKLLLARAWAAHFERGIFPSLEF